MIKIKDLSESQISWLSLVFENKTKLSLFSNISSDSDIGEAELIDLEQRGIIDSQKIVKPEVYIALKMLADAKGHVGISLVNGINKFTKLGYFTHDSSVSVDIIDGKYNISSPIEVSYALDFFNQFTGSSSFINSQLSAKLEYSHALVFSLLLDLYRKFALCKYIGQDTKFVFSNADITEMYNKSDSAKWLSYIMKAANKSIALSEDVISSATDKLYSLNLIEKNQDGYSLTGEALIFAGNFLVIENIITVRNVQEVGSDISISECVFVQAGISDILMLDMGSGKFEFDTISGIQMIDMLKTFLIKTHA